MLSNPLISIITVTYNAEKEVGKTIESLKEQEFQDFEHILIDGDSTDRTLSIIKTEAKQGSIIVSEKDKGIYDAMNKGLKLAQGKYVIFLNAGDSFFDKESLKLFAEEAMKGYDIIYGDTCIVDESGEVTGKRHLDAPKKLEFNSFSKGMLICHQAFMVKKCLTENYDLSYRFSADYDWTIKCISKTTPENNKNLNTTVIKFLQAGTTDKNKIKSLKERFSIMCRYYGKRTTLMNHLSFVWRALKRGKL